MWSSISCDSNVLSWIHDKVDISNFFHTYSGTFQGVQYNDSVPPARLFRNSANCEEFNDFINKELINRLKSGAISYLGRVGQVPPPRVVSPITIEPSKPRLCINLMYINCFMKDTPFKLDTLNDVPLVISRNAWITKLDDKSGYDHVFMTDNSKDFLGFQWGGHYFCCNTLPFGWKNSAYVYHTLNMTAMSFIRSRGINGLVYIDDRLIEEFKGPLIKTDTSFRRSDIAIRFVMTVLGSLGYFLNISKSILIPCQHLLFLGMVIDTPTSSFFVTEKRKLKIAVVREFILSKKRVPLRTIQQFVGLCISTVLALPGAKLFTAACNRAVASAELNSCSVIEVDDNIRKEVQHWQFLDSWNEPFPWFQERHVTMTLSTDASNYKWGAVLHVDRENVTFSDFWSPSEYGDNIMIKEAKALLNALKSVHSRIRNTRLCVNVDNQAVVEAWKNQYSTNDMLNSILKEIYKMVMEVQCLLTLVYIPSEDNSADEPSRKLSKNDCKITRRVWYFIETHFGPHNVDMFSLDSNAMISMDGHTLKHFTLFPTPNSSGVDAFAQSYSKDDNCYAFPPFCLIPCSCKIHY
ncbi:hypothetical protein FSP39_002589 [Pinctada imbricata]|uniref:Reverse transcriptase domain-containing protein n=1 Tax=Pinctada imbricata TaxID=66713 RepID=A0AA88YQG1_PINIB|nr:hypothetical protein FSP39_002589 [Pinctada imbricata]